MLIRVIQACLLRYLATFFNNVDLPIDLEIDRFLDEAKRVQVLEFGSRTELFLPARPYRHVRIAAERSFLHVAVGDVQVAHNRVNLAHVRDGFACRTEVRL